MKFRDSYNKRKKLVEELKVLRTAFYDYEANLTDEDFCKVRKQIKEIKNKLDFLDKFGRANERVNQKETSRSK